MGCKIWNKNVKTIHPVALSDYVNKNKKQSYDNLPPKYQFDGDFNVVQSYYPYQHKLKLEEEIEFDQTYEEKEKFWDWMVKNIKPSKKVLFWDVGIKEYDLEYIEPISRPNQNTRKSLIERIRRKHQQVEHNFF